MTAVSANTPRFPHLPSKLSALVRFETVSSYDQNQESNAVFSSFTEELKTLFPLVHDNLKLEKPSSRSLLYIWEGRQTQLKPAILCAHYDVVPVPAPERWKHPPFSGEIVDGELWGRGAQDIKILMTSMLEVAETLISQGFMPNRTIYFAFGGDEEIGGFRGARAIAALLEKRHVRASFLIDEGGPIAVGMLSFVKKPIALISVAEKGYADIEIEVKGKGGHASMPPKTTVPGLLSRAIVALEAHPSPPCLTNTVISFLKGLARESSALYRFLFGNLWLTKPLVLAAFGKAPTTNALIRTTRAVTMLKGSSKENVLADCASATVNVRILPGESTQSVLERIAAIVSPHGATAKMKHEGHAVEPSQESGTDHEGWKIIEKALALTHPETLCLPFLFSAGTDTKHYRDIVEATYRFTCLPQTQADLQRVHGDDERVLISDLDRCAHFYEEIIRSL
jgi:carboxypeptidase PM20D1